MDTLNADTLDARKCFPLLPLPSHIETRYRRLVLVTERKHVDAFEATGEDGLIVSGDWLLWQRCLHEGRHAVHLDLGLLDWDGEQVGHNHMVWANDWVYVGDRDMTLFRGVSLGRKFYREVALVIADHVRLSAALDALIGRFRPRELVFYDCRTEDGFLDVAGRVAVATDAAGRAGIAFADRCLPAASHESGYPRAGAWERPSDGREPLKARLLRLAVNVYVGLWGRLSLAKRRLNGSRPGVLMVMTHITGKPLVENFQRQNLTPMYLGRWMPHKKSFRYWARHLKNGILSIDSPRPGLDVRDLAALEDMKNEIKRALAAPADACRAVVCRYVLDQVVAGGDLIKMAAEVKWAERLVEEFRPTLAITDGLKDVTSLIFLELTRRRGIPNAVTWHGPYVGDVKMDMFGCDPRMDSLADFSLTWGKVHEDWLDGIGAKTTKIRTGNLVSSNYRALPPPPNRGNALVLQFVSVNHELVTPLSNEYFCYVEIVRLLKALGYSSVRMRFHPGTSKRKYYDRIRDTFGLDGEMSDTGAFWEVLEWADLVIGPANSGAMAETIAAGRPYYPVALKPHAINMRYVQGSPLFEDLDSLRRQLGSGRPLDQKQLLENFTSLREFPDAAERTWQVIESLIGERP